SNIVPKNALLFVTRTGVGKIAKAGNDIAVSQDITGIILKKDVDPDYVIYASSYLMKPLIAVQQGSTIKGILRSDLTNFQIPLPPFSEQRRIVDILDQADEIRKLRKLADEKSEKIIPALFYEMFGDPVTSDTKTKIKNIIKKIEQKNFRKYPDDEFKYIDISSVDGGKGRITSFTNYCGLKAPSRAKQIIKSNDVLVSTVRPYLKATALVPEEFNNQVCSTGFCVLRSKTNIGFGFLYALSRLNWFSDILMSMAKGASYPAVSDSDIFNLNCPYPTDNPTLIRKYDDIILNLGQKRIIEESSDLKIEALFNLLLSKAFDSSLTSSWRESHMKELLQEMNEQKRYLKNEN
ncbi:MAG: restriction endonuclease subunit S, partial [Bacteroidetes bacterium]|nr:restriction endonuclease subunit S [Bacteroidota bacterium]